MDWHTYPIRRFRFACRMCVAIVVLPLTDGIMTVSVISQAKLLAAVQSHPRSSLGPW